MIMLLNLLGFEIRICFLNCYWNFILLGWVVFKTEIVYWLVMDSIGIHQLLDTISVKVLWGKIFLESLIGTDGATCRARISSLFNLNLVEVLFKITLKTKIVLTFSRLWFTRQKTLIAWDFLQISFWTCRELCFRRPFLDIIEIIFYPCLFWIFGSRLFKLNLLSYLLRLFDVFQGVSKLEIMLSRCSYLLNLGVSWLSDQALQLLLFSPSLLQILILNSVIGLFQCFFDYTILPVNVF
jgi:hypothetical protein